MPLDHQPAVRSAANIVVFSDLDGTLLDHHSYRHDAAAPALKRLAAAGIPLVLVTSKTAAEVTPLRTDLGFAHCPAVVENGAGTLEPNQDRPTDAASHGRLMAVLNSLPEGLRRPFVGFSDMDVAGIAQATGLSPEAARNAASRDFSEPGRWTGEEAGKAAFLTALQGHGIVAQQGGRFLTLSFGGDKAGGLRRIASRYRNGDLSTIALGDAPNDAAMLAEADYGVVVRNPDHGGPGPIAGEAEGRVVRTTLSGPAGWNEAVNALLDRLTEGEV